MEKYLNTSLKRFWGVIYNYNNEGDETYKNKDDDFWDEMIAEVDTNGDGEVNI